ncbi:consortin-like isoform X1 [Solea senegalensis]|uniref:Consortin-like isoform X1 n=1 Tax=Solea senegalensis TaxID=28829 RepID=A0AAV6RU31_SOLSE|nr:consortin, connexin sorting protein b [Solea senegalensis]KAG7508956.1 consortin-like isoform X1 [Solea senegalensis]
MGNKSTSLSQGPDAGPTHREDGALLDNTTGSVSRDGPLGLSPELLASLQSLGENSDYTLLPHSLHQIAEAFSLQEDYQWAIQFLQLEKLYHERLLSNLAALQENWESRWREKNPDNSEVPAETDTVSENYIQALIQICQTHPRPTIGVEKSTIDLTLKESQMKNQTLQCCHNEETSHRDVEPERKMNSGSETSSLQTGGQEGNEEEVGEEEKEVFEEGQEVEEEEEEEEEGTCAETPEEEEEVKVEWPSGVPQASDKELAKLSNTEGISSPDGLVSILKRRRASLDGLPPTSTSDIKPNSTRKVRFSEPDDGIEQDEVGGDSCLILLLLCLVTVVISIGGTALYCTLVDTYSNICTDFTQNVNFYAVNVQRFFEGLGHWLPLRT